MLTPFNATWTGTRATPVWETPRGKRKAIAGALHGYGGPGWDAQPDLIHSRDLGVARMAHLNTRPHLISLGTRPIACIWFGWTPRLARCVNGPSHLSRYIGYRGLLSELLDPSAGDSLRMWRSWILSITMLTSHCFALDSFRTVSAPLESRLFQQCEHFDKHATVADEKRPRREPTNHVSLTP